MRRALAKIAGWSTRDWLRIVAFLALPNCTNDYDSLLVKNTNFDAGPLPHTSAIMCDIEEERHCATDADLTVGIRLAAAAVALNTGQSSVIGIDESPEARANCPNGEPEAVTFHGPFPEGFAVCLNCSQINPDPPSEAPYADPDAACVVMCTDVHDPAGPQVPPDPATVAFCQAHARASTNHPDNPEPCFDGACEEGVLKFTFNLTDPRRIPEPIVWRDDIGVSINGNSLTKFTDTSSDPNQFDAGAASEQWITKGDAYIEFQAAETNLSHIIGFALVPTGCLDPDDCPDTDPNYPDIDFALSLNLDGRIYVLHDGILVDGPDVNASFGTYGAFERFRVSLTDQSDETATVHFSRISGLCTPGDPCAETVFYTHTGAPATYPLRVNAALREEGATLEKVTVVRIR
jgi:hypothetical protein